MTQKGTHTWDLILHYHLCPHCGYIFESRADYQYRLGSYQKDLECPRCHTQFMVTRNRKHHFGPLLGGD
jgi:uncharacterized C2H2 Zn-finger protein